MDTEPLPPSPSTNEVEREARIKELEASLARPPKVGVTPLVAVSALVLCAGGIWWTWDDTTYFFSSRDPIQLGAEGDYRFDAARDNRYAELHGIPTSRGAFGIDRGATIVAVGVRDTPVIVWRRALRGEEWVAGSKAPPPNQQPFTVRGRLLSRGAAGTKYEGAFDTIAAQAEINPKWVLVESARPGSDLISALISSLLVALAGFNLWLLFRGVRALMIAR